QMGGVVSPLCCSTGCHLHIGGQFPIPASRIGKPGHTLTHKTPVSVPLSGSRRHARYLGHSSIRHHSPVHIISKPGDTEPEPVKLPHQIVTDSTHSPVRMGFKVTKR